jgi:hypothetical protein
MTWLICIYILVIANQLQLRTCPHGTTAGIGPVGVAYSPVGGPCRNSVPIIRSWRIGGNWYVYVARIYA